MFPYLSCFILVAIIKYSAQSTDVLTKPISKQEECKSDVPVLLQMCELHENEIENNWAFLDCLDKIPPEKKISDTCENLVWRFKLDVTRTDYFLEEAKKVCGGEEVCGHEAGSEPGHLLACLVGKRHETKSIQCSQFLTQVGSNLL